MFDSKFSEELMKETIRKDFLPGLPSFLKKDELDDKELERLNQNFSKSWLFKALVNSDQNLEALEQNFFKVFEKILEDLKPRMKTYIGHARKMIEKSREDAKTN